MKTLIYLGALLTVVSVCHAQESGQAANKKLSGFEWIKQFEGNWDTLSRSPQVGDQPAGVQKSTMSSRAIGKLWIINEFNGKIGDTDYTAVQTIGFDRKKNNFTVTWIDSIMDYTWRYTGEINDAGDTITMEADGPDWSDPKKTRRYRDIYRFKSSNEIATLSQSKNNAGQWETFMEGTMTKSGSANKEAASAETQASVTPFLMYTGRAEEAIKFYKTVFPDLKVESMVKYKAGETGPEGTVQLATIRIAGQQVKMIDSPIKHDFDFTPSFSFFVDCKDEKQLKERFARLSAGGKVMMPLNKYEFSKQFGWASDKFGVSWQLNLK